MAHPLRIEYPEAWYHVMNRGRRGENIFSDDQDYIIFTDLLRETSEIWNVRIAAYCLIGIGFSKITYCPCCPKTEKTGYGTIENGCQLRKMMRSVKKLAV